MYASIVLTELGRSSEVKFYGDEKEWKAHFEFLLPFFKDKRYLKIEWQGIRIE